MTIIIAIFAIFCGCRSQKEQLVEYDGRLLTEDELKAIVFSTIQTEPEPVINLVCFGEEEVEEDLRLYWTSGGSVWHTRLMCGYLSKEGDIYYGTREQAVVDGKGRCCSACEKYGK